MGAISNRERLLEEARKFTLMSDIFMKVALKDKVACQYVLRIIMGIEDLIVIEVRTQYEVSRITSHDARLDILAEDSSGKLYNIEIQRSDTIDHARRTRFNGAMVDSEYLMKGKPYSELPDLCIIYISEKDIWKQNRTVYEVKSYLDDTGIRYDDGKRIIYVNAAVNDGSDIANLMAYFKTADPDDMSHGELSERVRFLKSEEGSELMCEVSDRIYNMGREEGRIKSMEESAVRMHGMGMTIDVIAECLGESADNITAWISGKTSMA